MSVLGVLKINKCYLYVAFIIAFRIHYISNTSCDEKISKDRVVIAALLGIHENSFNCTEVSLRGMQELAILEKVISSININEGREGLKIDLKVLDTCSNSEGVTRAVLKALIMSKQTCTNPPLLLGFVGPEDNKLLNAVQQVSATFDKVHVIPFAPDSYVRSLKQANVFSVGTDRTKQRCKALISMTAYLNWKSVLILRDDSDLSAWIGNYLTDFAKDYLCVVNTIQIPKFSAKSFFRTTIMDSLSGKVDGIVIIVENEELLLVLSAVIKELLANSKIDNEISFVVYLTKVGLKPWNVPVNTFILQEVSGKKMDNLEQFYNITLFGNYQKQLIEDYKLVNCAGAKYVNPKTEEECLASHINVPSVSFTEVIDTNVLPLEYSVRLLWSALKSAHHSKCRFDSYGGFERGVCNRLLEISLDEWKLYLQKTIVQTSEMSKKITFQMAVPYRAIIYIKDTINGLTEVGYISDNGTVYFEKIDNILPVRKSKKTGRCNSENVAGIVEKSNIVVAAPTVVSWTTASKVTTPAVRTTNPEQEDANKNWSQYYPDWLNIERLLNASGDDWLTSKLTLVGLAILFCILFFYCIRCIYRLFRVKSSNDY